MVVKDGAKVEVKGNAVDPTRWSSATAPTRRGVLLFAAPPGAISSGTPRGGRCFRFRLALATFEKAKPLLPAPGTPPPRAAAAGDALALRRKTHQTIRRVTDDLGPRMHLNTPVAAIMELLNMATPLIVPGGTGAGEAWALREAFETIARVMAPFAPHVAEELWEGWDFLPSSPDGSSCRRGARERRGVARRQINGKVRQVDVPARSPKTRR
jgi:leucyl-tRNA synthetase